MKLTQKAVTALALPAGKSDHIAWDDELPRFGFRLRRSHDGAKVLRSWIVQYSKGVRSPRIKLGDAALLSAEQARAAAKKLLAQVALAEDPAASRRERRDKDALTMRALVDQYLAAKEADLAPRTLVESTRYLTDPKYFGPLHRMAVDQITLRDVAARIVAIKRLGNATASRARGALVTFFVWAMRQGLCSSNPTIGSENVQTRSRDRVLTGDELAAIWKACGDDHYGKIIKLLICTGCRRAEIGDMCHGEIDHERGTWTLPKERAKTGKSRVIPLLPMLLEILDGVPRMASRDQLFGERSHGFTAWAKGKRVLDQRCGVAGWTVHDIRRTVATMMAEELAIQPHVVELILGHEFRTGVQATYNRAPYAREIASAYSCWHDYLRSLIGGAARKIIPFTS